MSITKETDKFYCPICQKKNIKTWLSTHNLRVYKCKSCWINFVSITMLRNKKEDYFDAFSIPKYISYYKSFRTKIFKENWKFIASIKPKGKALDLGASFGWFQECAPKSWKVISIEQSKKAVAYAKLYGVNVKIGDENTLKNKKQIYDLITLHNVFEHMPNPLDALTIFYNALKPKGLLVITIPNKNGLINRLAQFLGLFHIYQPVDAFFQIDTSSPHLFYYCPDSITKILTLTGFKPLVILPQPIIDINNLGKRLLVEGKKNTYVNKLITIGIYLVYYMSLFLHMPDEIVIYSSKP